MTKLDWRRVGVHTPDPGAVVEVFDTGGVFCGNDNRPFVPKSKKLARAAARAKNKRRKSTKIKEKNLSAEAENGLILPASKIRFIMSVMRDIGMPMPIRIKPLNKTLRALINIGVIDQKGDFILNHHYIENWANKMIGKHIVK